MLEIIGIVFGGLARLGQHWMELADKQKEREHEAIMFEKQITLQTQRIEAEKDLRKMDVDLAREQGELDALMTAIQAQAHEASSAGGWVARLSASVRPIVSYWLLALYTVSKFASIYLIMDAGNVQLAEAVRAAYTEFDGAMLGSVLAFWFADRSLAKRAGTIA